MTYLALTSRALLAVVFAVAFHGKAVRRGAFVDFARSLAPLGPVFGSRPVAAAVVAAEAGAAVLLVLPGLPVAGLAAAAALLAALSAGIALVLRGRRPVRCNCFGTGGAVLDTGHLTRNCVLLVVAFAGLAGALSGGPATPVRALLAAAGGAVVGAVLTRWDDLRFLFAVDH